MFFKPTDLYQEIVKFQIFFLDLKDMKERTFSNMTMGIQILTKREREFRI